MKEKLFLTLIDDIAIRELFAKGFENRFDDKGRFIICSFSPIEFELDGQQSLFERKDDEK